MLNQVGMTNQIEISNIGDQVMVNNMKPVSNQNKNEDKKLEVKVSLWSGRKCTQSGEWEIEGRISTTAYFSKGDLMPAYCEKHVKWILIRKG